MTKKSVAWISIGVVGVFFVLCLTGLLILRSQSFHRYALAKIISGFSDATGARVEISSYTFRFVPLQLDLYDVVIHGTEGPLAEPLAQAQHVGFGLKIVSLLRRKVDLKEIVLDHPKVRLSVDAQGRSNLPVSPNSNSTTNIFDLAVNHTVLNSGEIYYNDRKLSVDADVRDLHAQVDFPMLKRQYQGRLGYHEGRVQFGTMRPLQHDLDARFIAARDGFSLEQLAITSGTSSVILKAKLTDYSRPVIDGTYQVTLTAGELRRAMRTSPVSSGDLLTNGSIHYQIVPDRTFIETAIVDGKLASQGIVVETTSLRSQISQIHGDYKIENGDLSVRDLRADLLGGRLNANLSGKHLAKVPAYNLDGNLQAISIAALDATAGKNITAHPPLQGNLDAKFSANWTDIANLQVRSDATIKSNPRALSVAANTSSNTQSPIPLNGILHVRYEGARSLLSFAQSYLRTPATELRLDGTVGTQAALKVQVHNTDLREIDLIALGIREASLPKGQIRPQPFGLYGAGDFVGQASGSTKDLHLTGSLVARDLQVHGSQWRSLRANVALSPSSASLQQGELIAATQGRVQFDVTTSLNHWSYSPSSPIDVQVHAAGLAASDIERLAGLQYPVTGLVSANVALRGTSSNPQGQAQLRLTDAKLWNQPVRSLVVDVQGAHDSLNSSMQLQSPTANGTGKLTYSPGTQGYDLVLDLRAADLSAVDMLRNHNIQTHGEVTLSASGRGTLKQPQLKAALYIPELQSGQKTISGFRGGVEVAEHRANVDLVSSVSTSSVQAHGVVDLNSPYNTTATLQAQAFPLGPLLAAYLPGTASGMEGQFDLHASLKGPLSDPMRIETTIEIPTLKASYQSWQIANVQPIRADYRDGILKISQARIKGNDTDIQLVGTVPFYTAGPLNLQLHGNADLKVLSLISKDTSSNGQLVIDVTAAGSRSQPNFDGKVRLVNAGFSTLTAPLGADRVNAEISIKNNRFEIVHFDGQAGGGNIAMQGFVIYQSGLQFSLALDATTVRLRYPEGLRAILNGRLMLAGTSESPNLGGNITIERLSFTHDFDLATFMAQFGTDVSDSSGGGIASRTQLDIALQSGGDLGLESSKLTLQGQANLRVRGTAANPVLLGRANLTDGELFFLNNRYHINQATLDFANPVKTDPVINLQASTKIKSFDLTINMVGPIDRLRTYYVSDPPLPPVDIINLLTRGTTSEQATPGNLGANALLAKGLASQVSSRLEKLSGISSLQIDPLLGGSNRNPSARVAIQEKITKDIIFTYAADVTSTQNELIQVEYQATPNWSLRVLRDERGNVSIEGRHHKNF